MVVALDQASKVWAVAALEPGERVEVLGEVLQFKLARNPGAAFSLFQDGGQVLGVLAAIVVVGVAWYLPRVELRSDFIALSGILGGAIGNLVDRIFRGEGILDGAVVDFIDLLFIPTFNVADAALSLGVAWLMVSAFFILPRIEQKARAAAVEESAG